MAASEYSVLVYFVTMFNLVWVILFKVEGVVKTEVQHWIASILMRVMEEDFLDGDSPIHNK